MSEVRSTDGEIPPTKDTFHADATPHIIRSSDLFQGDHEILIQHGDQIYRLRITRANRLILNK